MNAKNTEIKVGIMSPQNFRKYTIAIAGGAHRPHNEPKIWFSSMKSLAHVLSEDNQKLLKLILDLNPQSVAELAPITGRKANNLLRTLRMMENYGFVQLIKGKAGKGRAPLIPRVLYNRVAIEIHLGSA